MKKNLNITIILVIIYIGFKFYLSFFKFYLSFFKFVHVTDVDWAMGVCLFSLPYA